MLIVETISKIRRAYFVQKKPIKVICRELRVSRKVVRKVIRSEATAFRYERTAQPLPKLGPWVGALDELLLGNEGKPARERLTLIRVFEELRGRGFEGSYDAVRSYARSWAKDRGAATAQAFVPLSFAAGEAYQFDWSHEIVVINGVPSGAPIPSGHRLSRYCTGRTLCRIPASRPASAGRRKRAETLAIPAAVWRAQTHSGTISLDDRP